MASAPPRRPKRQLITHPLSDLWEMRRVNRGHFEWRKLTPAGEHPIRPIHNPRPPLLTPAPTLTPTLAWRAGLAC